MATFAAIPVSDGASTAFYISGSIPLSAWSSTDDDPVSSPNDTDFILGYTGATYSSFTLNLAAPPADFAGSNLSAGADHTLSVRVSSTGRVDDTYSLTGALWLDQGGGSSSELVTFTLLSNANQTSPTTVTNSFSISSFYRNDSTDYSALLLILSVSRSSLMSADSTIPKFYAARANLAYTPTAPPAGDPLVASYFFGS